MQCSQRCSVSAYYEPSLRGAIWPLNTTDRYGRWTNLVLASEEYNKPGKAPLLDCISIGHPSLTTKEDYDKCVIPIQILAPEIDSAYNRELKLHTFETLLSKNIAFDYRHFSHVEHSCFVRGDPSKPNEQEAMTRGKNAAVDWMREWLHPASM